MRRSWFLLCISLVACGATPLPHNRGTPEGTSAPEPGPEQPAPALESANPDPGPPVDMNGPGENPILSQHPLAAFLSSTPGARSLILSGNPRAAARGVAVEDEGGVTVCVRDHPRGLLPEDTSMACVREEGAQLASGAARVIEHARKPAWLILLRTDAGLRLRAYATSGASFDAPVPASQIPAAERAPVARTGQDVTDVPWPRTIAEANRDRRRQEACRRGRCWDGRERLRAHTAPRVAAPAWVELLDEGDSANAHVLAREGGRTLQLVSRGDDGWGSEMQAVLLRFGGQWRTTREIHGLVLEGRFSDALRPSTFMLLTRLVDGGSGLDVPHADLVSLQLHEIRDHETPSLVLRASHPVGEIGFVRFEPTRSIAWRAFHHTKVVSTGCIDVSLDHALSALYDRRSMRFSRERPLRFETDAGPDAPGLMVAQAAGRFSLGEGGFETGCSSSLP